MDKIYIKKHLKGLAKLIFDGEPFATKTKKEFFIFGSKDKSGNIIHKNKVEKAIAIFITAGIISKKQEDENTKKVQKSKKEKGILLGKSNKRKP